MICNKNDQKLEIQARKFQQKPWLQSNYDANLSTYLLLPNNLFV